MKRTVFSITAMLALTFLPGYGKAIDNSIPNVNEIESSNVSTVIQLYAKPGINKIQLKWNRAENATAYLLEWGETTEVMEDSKSFADNHTMFLHKHLERSTTYYYRITVQFSEDQSSQSSKILAVTTGKKKQVQQSDTGPKE